MKETLEEATEKYGKKVSDKYKNRIDLTQDEQIYLVGGNIVGFIEGSKWQAKISYTEEDMKKALYAGLLIDRFNMQYNTLWEERIKKLEKSVI